MKIFSWVDFYLSNTQPYVRIGWNKTNFVFVYYNRYSATQTWYGLREIITKSARI